MVSTLPSISAGSAGEYNFKFYLLRNARLEKEVTDLRAALHRVQPDALQAKELRNALEKSDARL